YGLAGDLAASPDLIWQRWAAATYGPEVGPQVVRILHDGTRVMAGSVYVRQAAFIAGPGPFPEGLERVRHLGIDRSAKSVDGGEERVAPTRENLRRVVEEKDAAIALSERILARIE